MNSSLLTQFNEIKRTLLENEFSKLNDMQKKAVFTSKGHMLILAGAGSGKTTTVVNKITYMLKYGEAYADFDVLPDAVDENTIEYMRAFADAGEKPDDFIIPLIRKNPVRAYNVLAFTFTNKAANEMKERITAIVGAAANDMWIGTFHSMCIRILRRNLEHLPGYNSNFVIYDTADQQTLMKVCLAEMDLSEKLFAPKEILGKIGRAKDKLITPEMYIAEAKDFREKKIGEIYAYYQKKLRGYNALDFDDIINHTVYILKNFEDVRDYYTSKFKYVLVDEYQDTNKAQYELISLLCEKGNLCVVGDDDQSIYAWRGADIQNIIDFEKNYKDCRVIKLEQNYRSTQNILDAANTVILNNENRKGKNLWTSAGKGDKISIYHASDDRDEAEHAIEIVSQLCEKENMQYSDFAFLYRNHSLSRVIEDTLVRSGIAYKIIGGVRFYERKEIKDVLAYIHAIVNPADDISIRRIINFPRRGIGDTSVDALAEISESTGLGFLEIIRSDRIEELGRARKSLASFAESMRILSDFAADHKASELISKIVEETGMVEEYMKEGEIEGATRLENIDELISVAAELEENGEIETINEFLEYTALITDTDVSDENSDAVTLMTIHAAKGLEFPVVFVTGMEEGIFPKDDPNEADGKKIEEERRLCYVAITRAKAKLFLSRACKRMMYGKYMNNFESRFLEELPTELTEEKYASFIDNDRGFSAGKKQWGENSWGGGFESSSAVKTTEGVYMPKEKTFDFMKTPVSPKPSTIPNFGKSSANESFSAGDRVLHPKFGAGMVTGVSGSGKMTILAINFDSCGAKSIISTAVSKL